MKLAELVNNIAFLKHTANKTQMVIREKLSQTCVKVLAIAYFTTLSKGLQPVSK